MTLSGMCGWFCFLLVCSSDYKIHATSCNKSSLPHVVCKAGLLEEAALLAPCELARLCVAAELSLCQQARCKRKGWCRYEPWFLVAATTAIATLISFPNKPQAHSPNHNSCRRWLIFEPWSFKPPYMKPSSP